MLRVKSECVCCVRLTYVVYVYKKKKKSDERIVKMLYLFRIGVNNVER